MSYGGIEKWVTVLKTKSFFRVMAPPIGGPFTRAADMMILIFRDAGFDLRTELKGEQFAFDTADGEVRGHVDGIIVSGPLNLGYPMLWECK